MLGTFLTRQRVLHDDHFYVHVFDSKATPPIDPGVGSENCSGNGAPDETTQLTATTADGGVFHTARGADGSWTAFENVERATRGSLTPVDAAAAIAGGRRHLVVAAEDGELWHTIRSADGAWTPFGNVEDFAGEAGAFKRVAAGGIGGSLHVVVVTPTDDVLHTIRRPDGTWTPLHSVEDFAGNVDDVTDVAAGGLPDGTLQVAISLSDGRLLHSVRAADGTWTGWGDVEAFAGDPGDPASIAASTTGAGFHLVADYGVAGVRHAMRRADGGWTQLDVVNEGTGDPGPVADVALAATDAGGLEIAVASSGGPLWHTMQSADGSWTPYSDVKAFAGNPGGVRRIAFTGT